MALKPQDVYVVLKLVADGRHTTFAQLGLALRMSPSEVHASLRRARESGLVYQDPFHQRPKGGQNRPNIVALEEFLVHGLKYVFPAERGAMTRGVPTSYAAKPLKQHLAADGDPVPVWPYDEGKTRGVSLLPLYRTAPAAALHDQAFYELLVLADALRDGRIRERKMAEAELHRRLQEAHAAFQS